MRCVVIYESMFGNTHTVADQVAVGLREGLDGEVDVGVVPVGDTGSAALSTADLVVVGGPTHVHGMARESSQSAAVEQADKDGDLHLDPDAEGELLRDWFDTLDPLSGTPAAAFDTRVDMSAIVTGRASRGIARRLERHGLQLVAPAESFLVDTHNHLVEGEAQRATQWGRQLAQRLRSAG